MTLVSDVVSLAADAARAPPADVLRVRLASNLAAAVGEQHEGDRIGGPLAGIDPGSAAWRMAAAMHARTQDDFYPPGRVHVGAVVIPSVLACDGPVLEAMAAGYEVLTLMSEAYASTAQQRGLRPTGVFGPLGAAVAAAASWQLTPGETEAAVALACTMSAGTNQTWLEGSDEWLVEVAAAARAGIDCARLASAGARGAPHALEGPAGWAAAYFDDPGARRLLPLLKERHWRSARVATKLYPVSGIAQVATALAADVGRRRPGTPVRIRAAMAPTELDYPGTTSSGPFQSRSDSLMSVPRCIALALLHGGIPYRKLLQPPDAAEQALIDAVELVPDGELDEGTTILTIDNNDGTSDVTRGNASQLLYPEWNTLRADADRLARRSEAPAALVRALVDEIDRGPSAAKIRGLLEGAT